MRIFRRSIADLCALDNRICLSVAGSDSHKFLQGLVTNQIQTLDTNRGLFCGFLNSKGRVLFDAFIYRQSNDKFIIEVDVNQVKPLEQHLHKYKLRQDIAIKKENLDVWQVWPANDEHPNSYDDNHEAIKAIHAHGEKSELAIRDPRHPRLGFRFLLPYDESHLKGNVVTQKDYLIKRIKLGIPEGPLDFVYEVSNPLESNLDKLSAIDFNKGCYLGQELVIRTHHTGVVRKRIMPVQFAESDAEFGDAIGFKEQPILKSQELRDEKSKLVGRVGSVVGNIGLALLRLDQPEFKLASGILKAFPIKE